MKHPFAVIHTPWKDYQSYIWRCAPEHGDYTTDIAFVLAQIGKDAQKQINRGGEEDGSSPLPT